MKKADFDGWADTEDDDGLLLDDSSDVRDDSLWQSERESFKAQIDETYEKLLKLNTLLKSMTQLVRELDGGDNSVRQALRKERNEARLLCSEVESELSQLSRQKNKLDVNTMKKLEKLRSSFVNLGERITDIERMAKDLGASSLFGSYLLEDYSSQTSKEQVQTQISGQNKPGWELERDQDLNKLENDMNEVLQLYVQMNDLIQQQQPQFDELEDKYAKAEADSNSAVSEIALSSKYAAYSLPLVGAAVGALVLGPVGAVAGAKGALAISTCVLSGMGLGAWAGTKIANKKKEDANLVLQRDD